MSRSEEKSDPKVKFLSITLAIVMTLFWAFLIAGTWYFFKIKGHEAYEGTIVNWVARFHVMAVHFPIGLIFLVVLMELFGRMPGFSNLRSSVSFVLWITLIGAIGASLLGFLLMEVEDYSKSRAMTLHMWTGLGVVVLTLITLVSKLKEVRVVYSVALLLTVLGVSAAGHYGGASVHGANYLSKDAPGPLKTILRGGLPEKVRRDPSQIKETPKPAPETPTPAKPKIEPAPDAAAATESKKEAALVYQSLIEPMLEKTCYKCHSDNGEDIDGELRMDSIEHLLKGGESDFPTLVQGEPNDSEMLVRVLLDPADSDFMPTKGKPLTKDEVELMRLWIKAGGDEKVTLADLGDAPGVNAIVDSVRKTIAAYKEKKSGAGE